MFASAMGPGVSGPPFRCAVGHPDLPRHPLRHSVGTKEEVEGEVGDGGGRAPGRHQQRQDGWLRKKQQQHPSSLTQNPETRGKTNEVEED